MESDVGNYRIVIEGVGSHGCQRDVAGESSVKVQCDSPSFCPDCAARALVDLMCRSGENVTSARLYHWLDNVTGEVQSSTVVDDLKSLQRHGTFNLAPGESNVGPVLDWDATLPVKAAEQ